MQANYAYVLLYTHMVNDYPSWSYSPPHIVLYQLTQSEKSGSVVADQFEVVATSWIVRAIYFGRIASHDKTFGVMMYFTVCLI